MRLSSLKSGILAAGIVITAATWPGASARAQVPTTSGGGDVIVARVGSRVITAADLSRRIAGIPLFQLRGYGHTPEQVRRNFLERVMVRELLFSEGATAAKLEDRLDVQERIRNVLRGMILARIRVETAASQPVTDEEVRAYYEQNRDKYNTPPRIAIWRIVVASREDALHVIEDVKKDTSAKRWTDIARERSLDKSTNMRGGNLGFVNPDGSTSEPEIKVSPEIVAAVANVKDGELVSEPVKDGDRYAILWRRQSIKAVTRTVEQEDLSIKQIISHAKIENAVKSLLERLHNEHVTELSPELVDQLDITSSGDLQPLKRPGTLPSSRRPTMGRPTPNLAPRETPGGLR